MHELTKSPTARDGQFAKRVARWAVSPAAFDIYVNNISDWKIPIAGALKPKTSEHVSLILRAANASGAQLHPISRGANWGFGSKLPPKRGAWILDLSLLGEITDFDSLAGIITVGPGVTQGMLDDFLSENSSDWCFNVTGSGRETSLIGNVVQRGVGYFGMRSQDLLSCEVIRGDGRTFAFPEKGNKTSHLYPHGFGPNWQGVVAQTDFAIVLSMTFRLRKRSQAMEGFLVQIPQSTLLPRFIDVLAGCLQEGWITSVPHIGNRRRTIETLGPYLPKNFVDAARASLPEWSALIPLSGPKKVVEEMANSVMERLGSDFIFGWIGRAIEGQEHSPLLDITKELSRFVQGRATDVALASVAWPEKLESQQVDESPRGLRYLNALIPLSGKAVDEFLTSWNSKIEETAGLDSPSMTLNAISGQCLVAIISLAHERSPAGVKSANRLYADLSEWLFDKGYPPYRLTLGTTQLGFSERSSNWRLNKELKAIWDPNGVLV